MISQVRIMDPVDMSKMTLEEQEAMFDDCDSALDEGIIGDHHEFDSNATLREFEINVSDQLMERCATQLSTNEKVVGGQRSSSSRELGTVRHMAVVKNE